MQGLGAQKHTPWFRIGLIWLVLSALVAIINARTFQDWRFPDPDDMLRLVQVRDLLAGQGWFDLHQYRINPGDSPVMHWSRLVDAPIAATILLLRQFVSPSMAEDIALVAVPFLTLGVIIALVGHMAFRLFDREIAGFACLACGLSPVLVWQTQPLRIDHHAWQIAAVLLAVGALIGRRPVQGGALAGFAIAVGLSISLEVLPHAALIGSVLLIRWLRDPAQRWWLSSYLTSLAASLIALFALTHGLGNLTQYCDAISPAHLGLFAIVALGCSAVAKKQKLPPAGVLLLLGMIGAVAVGFFVLSAPRCLEGPFGSLDPLVRDYWYVNIAEGRPFWVQAPSHWFPSVAQGLVALAATMLVWLRAKGAHREWWLEYTILLAGAFLTGLLVWRSMGFVGALGAVPLGWLAVRLIEKMRHAAKPAQKLVIGIALIVTLQPGVLSALGMFALESPVFKTSIQQQHGGTGQISSDEVGRIKESSCQLPANVATFSRLAPATMFAPLDIGPDILARTHHRVIATSHHRAQLAMHDVILAFISPEGQAHEIVKRHKADYIVVCMDLPEPRIYTKNAPRGLMAQLVNDNPPTWLREMKLNLPDRLKVWKVVN